MGKIELIESGFRAIRKWPKREIDPNGLKYIYKPKTSAPVDEFVGTVPKKKVTQKDIFNFRQYLLGKEVDIKISHEEIKTLFAYEGEDFKLKAFEFLTKKLNVSEKLKPPFLYLEVNPNIKMAYDYSQNIIFVNPNAQFADKSEFFSLLRHEYQHYKQNMNIFRHPEKGNEAVEIYSKILAKAQVQSIDNQIRNFSIDELKGFGWQEEAIKEFQMAKDMLSKNQVSEYEKYLQELRSNAEETHFKVIGDLRANVVEEQGLLKEGSREAGRAKKFFEATAAENSYFQKDGNIDYGKYLFDIRENEAIAAQDMVRILVDDNHSCYLKAINKAQEALKKLSKKDKVVEDSVKYMEEQNAKGVTFKDIISYLFD